jgi:hypothetical protein
MKKALILLLLILVFSSIVLVLTSQAQQPVPYQDVQLNGTVNVPVAQGNKDFNLWYIIGAFATAISFLATMYIRTHGQLMAEKDKMLNREIERNKEERQYDSAYDDKVKDLLSQQHNVLQGIEKSIALINENLTQIRINLPSGKIQ